MNKKEDGISHAEIKSLLSYDETTGRFTWLPRRLKDGRQFLYAGQLTGSVMPFGYRIIRVTIGGRKIQILEHRLAWFFKTGSWPVDQVDHIDGDRANNDWGNLREATHTQNSRNRKSHRADGGRVGVKQTNGKWGASITCNGDFIRLGTFDKEAEAIRAREAGEKKYFGQWRRSVSKM